MSIPEETSAGFLTHMFNRQRELQEMINKRPLSAFTDDERAEAIRDNVLAATDELHEAMNETGWKPWATKRFINREAFTSELADAMHFILNLALHADITPGEFYQAFITKNNKNWVRYRDGNYDGVTGKCPGCHRDYADAGVKCSPTHSGPDGSGTGWCQVYGAVDTPVVEA